jgi:uncharacterized protein
MSYAPDYGMIAAVAPVDARVAFIRKTYAHLVGAILAFIGVEAILLNLQIGEKLLPAHMLDWLRAAPFGWLIVLGAFMGVSYLAQSWAHSPVSQGMQYAGLGLYVVAESIIFLPILWIASEYFPGVIAKAAVMTLAVFAGLTVGVFVTKQDFSFLRTALWIGAFAMFALILASTFMNFNLGILVAFAGVALACGFILYDTSNVLHHYRTDQYVGAALALFASVALLFWYVLQIVMASSRD